MLIQITNRCHMECPHCMQDSNPDGPHMSDETFHQLLHFCEAAQPYVVMLTGGEPTEHPLWADYARELLRLPSVKVMVILTNGAWIENSKTRITMAKLIRSQKGRVQVQVYTNPKYYRDHKWTLEHEAQYRSIGCRPDFNDPLFMQDLGRARKNYAEEIQSSDRSPSCTNSHLLAIQTASMQHFSAATITSGKMCRPLIDVNGGIHMSESWLCPTVAHISDGINVAFQKMRASRPCGGCRLYPNIAKYHPQQAAILGITTSK